MPKSRTYRDVPLSIAHLSELEVAPADLIELAARAGFASVGLRTNAASPGGIEYPLHSLGEQAEMRRRMAATGVSVLYIELISLSEHTKPRDHVAMFETGAAIGATRLAVAGDSHDFAVVADKLAGVAELARGYGIAVDLEFMPFRAVKSLADAINVVKRSGALNAHILVDALHVARSGSPVALLADVAPAALGTFQLCDAPAAPPPAAELVIEARTRRLLPGAGALPIAAMLEALPADIPLGVEVPLAGQHPDLTPVERATRLVKATRAFLEQWSTPCPTRS